MEQTSSIRTPADAYNSRFPIEIWEKVFNRNLLPSDLVSLSRVNRVFYAISVRILYHSICPKRATCCISCLKSLCQNDLLASLVRNVEIDWQRPGWIPTSNLYRLVNRALRRLHRLEVLTLIFSPKHCTPSVSLGYILEGCSFRLTSLRVTFNYDASFADFLASQPGIVNLSICGNPLTSGVDFPLLPHALPRLTYLSAPMLPAPVLTNIIRGRYVHCVEFDYGPLSRNPASFEALALSRVPITRLSVRCWDMSLRCMDYVVQYAKNVQRLTLHNVFLPFSELADIHEYLSELPALKTLEICGLQMAVAEGRNRELASRCFQHCPGLEIVQLPNSAWRKCSKGSSGIEKVDGYRISPQLWSEVWRVRVL